MRSRAVIGVLALLLSGLGIPFTRAQSIAQYSLVGRVFEDVNNNGRFDNGEPCVDGVISLRPSNGATERLSTVACGQSPGYQFTGLVPGAYVLSLKQASPPDFTVDPVLVNVPRERQHDLPLRRQPRVSGLVGLDKNGNRQLDPGEPGVAGARIDVINAITGELLGNLFTASNGTFAFLLSRPGEYLVVERDPSGTVSTGASDGGSGHAQVLDANRIRVKVDSGQNANQLLFLDRSTANRGIAGRAALDSNSDGVLGREDAPLADLEVRLYDIAGALLASTRTLDDGSYFFDRPAPGKGYVIATAPPFGLVPRGAFAGSGALAMGANAILIPNYQTATLYTDNNFLLQNGSTTQPLPQGPATLSGFVLSTRPGSRTRQPLEGVTVLLHDAAGAVRAGATTGPTGQFLFRGLPIGSYTLTEEDPPGFTSLDVTPGQRGQKIDANTLRVDMIPGLNQYAGFVFYDQPGDAPDAVNSIEGTVLGNKDGAPAPLGGVGLVLQDEFHQVAGVQSTDGAGKYRFTKLRPRTYRLVVASAAGLSPSDAQPGAHAVRIDAQTLQIAMVPGVTQYTENNFILGATLTAPTRVRRLLGVGDPIAATGRLGLFGADPLEQDRGVSAIRRVGDDGAAYVADFAGAALLRFGGSGGPAQVLLDTSQRDPADRAGLARLLRVETAPNGVSAVVALRADNTRGIYRLEKGVLTRLALLSDPAFGAELAISDAGEIAFVAPTGSGVPALLQTARGQTFQVLGPGQALVDGQGRVILDGRQIGRYQELTGNSTGDLAFAVSLSVTNARQPQVVLRKTAQGFSLVAATGQQVSPERGAQATSLLTGLGRPLIGPDGTVVCRGSGDGFLNFYVDGPRVRFSPILPGRDWSGADGAFDYAVAANGAVAVRAAPGQTGQSALYLRTAGGTLLPVPAGGHNLPTGHPVFGPDGTESLLFFLARNLDRPLDRNGQPPVVLCRSRLANGIPSVDAVAAPGDVVPGQRGAQLLTITQSPVVSGSAVTFGALFGGSESFPVPTGGLFRVPLGGTLQNAVLLAGEGTELPGADRIALLRVLSYTGDGNLMFSGLLPGSGSLVGTLTPSGDQPPAIQGRSRGSFRTQATPAGITTPLLAIGQPLDRPDRHLLAVLGRLTALGANRQLLVARFSQDGGGIGEGLFTLARDGTVRAVAVTGDPAPGIPGARFDAFADTGAFTLSPPAVSADENVVFKARVDLAGTATFGVFQWNGATMSLVGQSDPAPDNLALSGDDRAPYGLERWAAGPAGRAYVMERHMTRSAQQVTRLFERSAAGLAPLIVPGVTPVAGTSPTPVGDLLDYVLNRVGGIFASTTSAGSSRLLSLGTTGLTPLAGQGLSIPPFADGTDPSGHLFDGSFSLLPDSAQADLVFVAGVTRPGEVSRKGLFRLDALGTLRTVLVEGLGVAGARNLKIDTLAPSAVHQTVSGTTATAFLADGRWQIIRTRTVVLPGGKISSETVTVAREGQPLPGGPVIVALDPTALLDLPPGSGPVFTLNPAGDVAFLASDGVRWGIYLFSDAGQ